MIKGMKLGLRDEILYDLILILLPILTARTYRFCKLTTLI